LLDEETKYLRFGFHIRNETIIDLCKRWEENSDKHVIFGIENDDLEFIGIAHISLEDEIAELAFSVIKGYQRHGYGSSLMSRAIEYCQNHNIKQGSMVCLAHNEAIKKLARKHNILVKTVNGDTEAEIVIPKPSAISIWKEYWEDRLSNIDHLGKTQRKFAKMFRFPLQF
jgi:RimJ/RimL family protein N-acetyltransferase